MSSSTYGKEHIIAIARPHENPNKTPPRHHQAPILHERITPETTPIPADIIQKWYGRIDN